MKCQNCGNELGQEEVFCGQCGAPNATPAQPTEMMQAPASRNGLLGDAYRNRTSSFAPNQSNPAFTPENRSSAQQSTIRQPQPQQAGGFYQDATEAISFVPGTPLNYPPSAHPQQGFNGGSMAGGYPGSGQFGSQIQPQPQQFLTGNYSNPSFPPTQMGGLPSGQFTQGGGYGGSGVGMPQPAPKRGNVVMIVGIVCLVFAIVTVGVFGALFALHNTNNQPQQTPVVLATATPTPIPSPTATATPSPTPTVAVTPTPAPDPNFIWCGTTCTQKGFLIEVYQGWGTQPSSSDQGIQFTSSDPTTYASVKLPAGSTSINDVLNNDLQEIATQNSATPTAPLSACQTDQPIGGESWTCETTTLQPNAQGQPFQTVIYATIYQGKAYVIELVSSQSSFTDSQNTYFTPMVGSFQFVSPTQ